jgi:hypothetical protein
MVFTGNNFMTSILNKILLILISLATLSIFVFPFCSVFFPGDENEGRWMLLFLIEDWVSLLFYLPFTVLWCIYLVRKRVIKFFIFNFLLAISAFITFIISFSSVTLIAQDYEPHIGVILSILILPLFVIFVINHGILIKLNQNANPS